MFIMNHSLIHFLFAGFIILDVKLVHSNSQAFECECKKIVVSSKGVARNEHPNTMGEFKLASSHFNAFKSTVYRNSKSLTLIGGSRQSWRIQGGSRAGRILIQNKSCKKRCPMNCLAGWKVYKRPTYVTDESVTFECLDEDGDNEGSADGKQI